MDLRRIVCIGILATGLGTASAEGPAPVNAPAGPATAPTDTRAPLGTQRLTLLDRGLTPRRALRWNLTEGQHELHRSVIMTETHTSIDGQHIEVGPEPDLVIDGELLVERISDDGEITIAFAFSPPGAPDVRGSYRMNDRGEILEVSMDDATHAAAAPGAGVPDPNLLDQHVRRTQLLLPEAAVGVGARWSVASDCLLAGARYEQVVTYTIGAMDADRVDLIVESKVMSDTPHPLDLPGLPAEARATIRNTLHSASGTQQISLSQIGPVLIKNESEFVQLFRVEDERQGGDAYNVLNHVFGVFAATSVPAIEQPALATAIDDEE